MEKYLKTISAYFRNNRRELIVIAFIILIASFVRLYHIKRYVIFLGDEGRDALVVRRMIVDHDLTLVGPTASVGGFYLGAIYYYFILPFLYFFNFDPVGPAVMVALVGVATVLLMYIAVRIWTNSKYSAAAVALLYATASGVVGSSRSSWNPHIMPFFSLLSMFSMTMGLKKNNKYWFIISGIAYGIAIQSHYLGLIIGVILAIATLVSLPKSKWIKSALYELIGFALGALTYIAFEVKVNFINLKNVIEFATRGGATTGPRSMNLIWLIVEMLRRTFESTMPGYKGLLVPLMYLCILGLIIQLFKLKKIIYSDYKLILMWLIVGLLGIGFYKGQLYPHYFGFLFPIPFILMGITIKLLISNRLIKKIVTFVIGVMVTFNLFTLNIWGSGSNLIKQTENVTKKIVEIKDDKPFNFALISSGNSDHAYRYFLEIMDSKPNTLEEEVTKQLIVVCEDYDNPCLPLGYPLWEVAGFGRAEIVNEWIVEPGIRIVKLIHHQDSMNLIGKPAPKG